MFQLRYIWFDWFKAFLLYWIVHSGIVRSGIVTRKMGEREWCRTHDIASTRQTPQPPKIPGPPKCIWFSFILSHCAWCANQIQSFNLIQRLRVCWKLAQHVFIATHVVLFLNRPITHRCMCSARVNTSFIYVWSVYVCVMYDHLYTPALTYCTIVIMQCTPEDQTQVPGIFAYLTFLFSFLAVVTQTHHYRPVSCITISASWPAMDVSRT